MTELIQKTGERIIPEKFESKEEYLLYLRHLFVYELAKKMLPKHSLVLDLGCGEGYGTNQLSKYGMEVVGLDIDKNTVAHASLAYGSNNHCSFKHYDGVNIPYASNTFDAVVSSHVIEHIKDDPHCVSEVWRILKIGGAFILTTPNRTHRLKPGQKPWNRFHVREYYPHELKKLLQSSFSEVKVWGIRGTKEVQDIEIKRLKRALRMISLDPLNLRALIPQSLKPIIIKFLRNTSTGMKKNQTNEDFLTKYSIRDYYIIRSKIEDSLDLLGICKK